MKIKTLHDSTNHIIEYDEKLGEDESFITDLKEAIVKPLEDQGYEFQGFGAISNVKDWDSKAIMEMAGIYILMFLDKKPRRKTGVKIPRYSDEGTTSIHYFYYGTLYIFIPMPF